MEVGQIRPGMVVDVPPEIRHDEYGSPLPTDAKTGLFSSRTIAGHVYPIVRVPKGNVLVSVAAKGVSLETKWAVYENPKLLEEIKNNIRTGALRVPETSVTSGSDPEIFVVGGDGAVIPSWKFLKEKKLALRSYAGVWEPFWDGFQAEFCPGARECLQQHMDSMQAQLRSLLVLAKAHDPNARLSALNTVEIPVPVMQAASNEEVRFRCTPSLNVYRDEGEPTPDPRAYRFRFAGGHLHAGFGGRKYTAPGVREIVRALDGILGVAGVSLAASWDTPERRKMYGRAGEFRLPAHGIEYRVLSNFWLRHPALAHLTFELFRGAIKFAEAGLYTVAWEGPGDDEIRDIINGCDVTRSRRILAQNTGCLEAILRERLYPGRQYVTEERMGPKVLTSAIEAILNGAESVIKDPEDMEKNWYLKGGWGYLCSAKGASWASVL